MKNILGKINSILDARGGFLRAVSILVGGTAFAQGIVVITLPIVTRLYTPSEFSLFAIYSSLVTILSVASCLRFEIAIPMPQENSEAVHLVILAFISNAVISLFSLIIIWMGKSEFITLLKQPDFKNLIWLVPAGVFLIGLYNIFQYWATRKKKFTIIARTRIVQSVSGVAVQILIGMTSASALGLIIGQIIKFSAGIRALGVGFWRDANALVRISSFKDLKATFKKNKNFPKYSALEALANSVGMQLPILLISSLVGGAEVGFLMLAMQVMAVPIAFIGNAISQVYLAHAAEKFNQGVLKNYTFQCINQLFKVGVIPLILISLCSPFVFPVVFGAAWQRAGEMVVWMLPWFTMQLIVSPISMALHIIGFQKVALQLQIAGLVIRLGGLMLMSLTFSQFMFEYYALSGFAFYLIFLITLIFSIDRAEKRLSKA